MAPPKRTPQTPTTAALSGRRRHSITRPHTRSTAKDVAGPPVTTRPTLTGRQKPAEDVDEPEATVLTARTAKLVEDIRKPFMAFTGEFELLTASRAALAPKFMKAFNAWGAETGESFVNFVRLLDPKVPEDRDGYRGHSSYQAAEYLRRLMQTATTEKDPDAPVPATATEVIVSLIATMQPVVDDMAPLWEAFEKVFHWTPRQVSRLQQMVGESPKPVLVKEGQERKLHAPVAA